MLKTYLSFVSLILSTILCSQETQYFNNIYNHLNGITTGLSMVECEDGYIGYGATINSGTIGQKLVFIKIGYDGEELIWKQFGNDYQTYYPGNVGGALIKNYDDNFILAFNYTDSGNSYGALLKIDNQLDTVWMKSYQPAYINNLLNCIKTNDKGYMLTGWIYYSEEDFSDPILLKTDSLGNYQWHQVYGGELADRGQNVIETPDGGYLIGGLIWEPGLYHSLDAMLIKTDSLGNEEWTQYYGNPDVDDGMALVAMADDGNYLVATVYGEYIIAPEARTGKMYLFKVDSEGNTVWEKKIGPKMMDSHIKNLRPTNDGNLIASGFFLDDTTSDYIYKGFMYKFSQEGDSIWMRDYNHFNNQYDWNMFYDAYPTSDNGYIAIGKARPDMGDNNMWIVKVDSMGCDTPGCITTVISEELIVNSEGKLRVWPNPAWGKLKVKSEKFKEKGEKVIRVYNSLGLKVEEVEVPDEIESLEVDVSKFAKGLYYLQLVHSGQVIETTKFIKY